MILLTVLLIVCFKFSIHEKWQSNQIHKLESELVDIKEDMDAKNQQAEVDSYRNDNEQGWRRIGMSTKFSNEYFGGS